MTQQKLILVGGGGHCRSVIDVVESSGDFEIAGILDIQENIGKEVLGYKIIGSDGEIARYAALGFWFHITVGYIKSNAARIRIYDSIKAANGTMPYIKSGRAHVSKHSVIGEGSIIMHNAIVNAGAAIGNNCIINTGTVIEHDAVIADQCHISTGAYINGGCKVGSSTFVGSNATLVQGVQVAEHNLIAAGSVVIANTQPGALYAGCPAVMKKEIN